MNGGECLALLLHKMGRADPAVMVNIGVDPGDLELERPPLFPIMDTVKLRNSAERLGGFPGMDLLIVTDDADLVCIPGMGPDIVVVIPPEMAVFEQDALYFFLAQQFLTALTDPRQIVLMDHFVTLEVEKPVAGTGGLGDIGLVCMFRAAGVLVQVPDGIENPDLVGPDAPDLFERMVIGV